MPRRRSAAAYARRKMRGKGLGDWLKKAWKWVKDNKILSRAASAIAPMAGEFAPGFKAAGTALGAVGLGRRRGGGQMAVRFASRGGRRRAKHY